MKIDDLKAEIDELKTESARLKDQNASLTSFRTASVRSSKKNIKKNLMVVKTKRLKILKYGYGMFLLLY